MTSTRVPSGADIRGELAGISPTRGCDRLAEISGLFHCAGRLHLHGRGQVALHLDVGDPAVARRAFSILRELGIRSEIRSYRRLSFERATRWQLHVSGDQETLGVLAEAGVLDRERRPLERPPRRVVARSCCRRAYLRGAFLGGGSLSRGSSPQLELRTATRAGAEFLQHVVAAEGVAVHVAERSSHALAYAKSWDAIETLLALAGASDAVLALEERSVIASTRGRANRLANADHANLVRTTRASREHVEAARRLLADDALGELTERLREAAQLRLRYPTLTLRELAARADPPATKAGMHRRLRRLVELAGG